LFGIEDETPDATLSLNIEIKFWDSIRGGPSGPPAPFQLLGNSGLADTPCLKALQRRSKMAKSLLRANKTWN